MKYTLPLAAILFVSGCDFEFDTGSKNYSFKLGQSIDYSCMVSNLKSIDGFEVAFPSQEQIILTKEDIESILKFDQTGNVVTGYSLSTKTEKSSDGYFHGDIESHIFKSCAENSSEQE